MLRQRLATAAVAIPLLLWLIFWAPFWVFRAILLALTFISLAEYFAMVFPDRASARFSGIAAGALVAVGMGHMAGEASSHVAFPAALFAVVALGLIAALLDPDDPARVVTDLGHTILGVLYAGAFLPHFIWLRAVENGSAWVLFVIAVAMAGDSAAYFSGRAFGKRKLMPSVSPKKTVEGAIGAFGGNLLAAVVVKALLLPEASWLEVIGLALFLGLLAQLGDLAESLLKRAFNTKDSGWLLPGHGGVLDRADSLVFPLVFLYYWVTLLRGPL